jgi:hypothetical protein
LYRAPWSAASLRRDLEFWEEHVRCMNAVAVVFAIDIPCLCSSYVVKGPADRSIAGVQLGCLTNYASEEKSGIPKSRYVMPNERVLGSFHGSCRKRKSASIVCWLQARSRVHAGHDVTCDFTLHPITGTAKTEPPTMAKEMRWSIRGSNSRPWRY